MSDPMPLQVAWDLRLPSEARKFRIAGELWGVYETQNEWGRSLIFESLKIARRVRSFPPDWRELTDEQLYALSWSR